MPNRTDRITQKTLKHSVLSRAVRYLERVSEGVFVNVSVFSKHLDDKSKGNIYKLHLGSRPWHMACFLSLNVL